MTELLPTIKSPLPPRLSMRQTPSELCDVLNRDPESPFYGLIRRASAADRPTEEDGGHRRHEHRQHAQGEPRSPTGCLFLYRNTSTGETDFDGVLDVRFYSTGTPSGRPSPRRGASSHATSRLMHGVGIRSMGRLMDRVLVAVNPRRGRRTRQSTSARNWRRIAPVLPLDERTLGRPRPALERGAERPPAHQRTVELPPPPSRRSSRRATMKFFFPDSQDQVDPSFDFVTESARRYRVRQRDDQYAHEALEGPPYDGILVSKTIVDGTPAQLGKYSLPQRHRLYRVGVRRFFRLDAASRATPGDDGRLRCVHLCPRRRAAVHAVDELIDFYDGCGFDLGISLDHVILGYHPARTTSPREQPAAMTGSTGRSSRWS